MVDNSATGNLGIDQEKSSSTAEHVNGTNLSQSNSNHLVGQNRAGILTMNLNHPTADSLQDTTDSSRATADTGDCANESQSNNINNNLNNLNNNLVNLANSSSTASLISGVNSVAGNVANSSLLGAAAAAGSVANNSISSTAPALNCGAVTSVINTTVNNSSIISQPPINSSIQPSIQSSIQSSNNLSSNQATIASLQSNQQLASGGQLPANSTANPAANPTGPTFLPPIGNSIATAAAATINLNNASLANGTNNSTIAGNLPHVNVPPVPASCPTPAANLITQPPLPIASSTAMATSNSVANVDIQDDSEDESEILEESPCGRWLKRKEEVCLFDLCDF